MARTKRAPKRKRAMKALPWEGAGLSLAMGSGASAGVTPTARAPPQRSAPPPVIALGEEDSPTWSCANLGFDRDGAATSRLGEKYAKGVAAAAAAAVARADAAVEDAP